MAYPRLPTNINKDDPIYKQNYQGMTELVDELHDRTSQATAQGKTRHLLRHIDRGQLLARDRLSLLLDEDSPFLELLPLAGWDMEDVTLGGSTVGGIGLVHGVEVMVTANIPTYAGGSSNETTVTKGARLAEIAMENRLPIVCLCQTAGANLSQQFRVFHRGGGGFRELARRSQAGIPTCTVVFGSSTAGGAYQPGMSDYIIMVKNQAQVFLGGPPLVKMATGEVISAEELGGADMHSRISGVSDQLAMSEIDAIMKAREYVASLRWKKIAESSMPRNPGLPPAYPIDELLGIVSPDVKKPFDASEVIARLVDDSRFLPFKDLYGQNLLCGWGEIHGFPVGILANNNVLFTPEANKATQFIRLCNFRNTPIVFLQNITGFMVGKEAERSGIIKAGSLFINAVSNSTVPAITIVMGASYGAGNYAMAGRAYHSRFLFSWPNSKCSVMGPDQLTGVMEQVAMDSLSARQKRKAMPEKEVAKIREMITQRSAMFKQQVEDEGNVYFTSARCLDDAIIDPRDTRDIVGLCLSVVHGDNVDGEPGFRGVSRM